jgi:hypothetical protein
LYALQRSRTKQFIQAGVKKGRSPTLGRKRQGDVIGCYLTASTLQVRYTVGLSLTAATTRIHSFILHHAFIFFIHSFIFASIFIIRSQYYDIIIQSNLPPTTLYIFGDFEMMKYSMTPLILVGLLLVSISSTARANDICSEAVAITTFPFSTTGDLTRATADFAAPTDTFRNLTCGISTEALGIWYRISAPDGPAFLRATVTDAPGTSIMINVALFEGPSCDEMECKTDREYQLENQRTEPKLTWFAKEEVSYFLHVAGINANQVGEFTLNVEVSKINGGVVPWRTGQLLNYLTS